MKKILQIPNYLYPHIGGIEQVARDIANSLSECEDLEQKIICFNEDAQDGDRVCRRGETVTDFVDGVEVVRCGCFAKVASQSLSAAYPSQLKKVLREFQPDIVILHYPNPFVSSFLLPMLPGATKLILWWHLDIVKQKVLGKLFGPQNLRLCRRADRIIATSPNYLEGSPYLSRFRQKCTVIPNCIRPERFLPNEGTLAFSRELRQTYAGKTVCFAVGRHVPYKGMEYLVRAGKLLDDSFVILIGGKGELTNSLKDLAGADKKIVFLGRIPEEEMAAYYQACDIFCFPSITRNEAFGLALAEAMHFGKPAVTFTVPGSGINYVSPHGLTGLECPNGDVASYAEALKKLAADAALREKMGKAAKERVEQNFLYDQFKENIKRLVESL